MRTPLVTETAHDIASRRQPETRRRDVDTDARGRRYLVSAATARLLHSMMGCTTLPVGEWQNGNEADGRLPRCVPSRSFCAWCSFLSSLSSWCRDVACLTTRLHPPEPLSTNCHAAGVLPSARCVLPCVQEFSSSPQIKRQPSNTYRSWRAPLSRNISPSCLSTASATPKTCGESCRCCQMFLIALPAAWHEDIPKSNLQCQESEGQEAS
ncbi:hypothetical protein B0H67DRAFT_160158 [Lasiosphaeris hirsuta]|uniref:Uncharacterized protein n=1 Tax=Lasiosphaeris hirsuta TaxID=260670 RepID=A0AA40E0E7_9PEZI|nr:hypothetical protein B0H67DRAFT_160158 [Lasiosphaeris hirsuta]